MSAGDIGQHKAETTVLHIDLLGGKVQELEINLNKLTNDMKTMAIAHASATNVLNTGEHLAASATDKSGQLQPLLSDLKKLDSDQTQAMINKITVLENVNKVMNMEFKKLLNELQTMTNRQQEMEKKFQDSENKRINLEKQVQLKDVYLAEQEMRINVS